MRNISCVLLLYVASICCSISKDEVTINSALDQNLEDLISESRLVCSAIDEVEKNVLHRINDVDVNRSNEELMDLLTSAIHLLESTLQRWKSAEPRFRNSIGSGTSANSKFFSMVANNVATSKAILGQLYASANKSDLAVREFQAACPALWAYQVSVHGMETDNWLDCYASLASLYITAGQEAQALLLERDLVIRMPWLSAFFTRIQLPSRLGILVQLSQYTSEQRYFMAVEMKKAWVLAHQMRVSLHDMIQEFFLMNEEIKQKAVHSKAEELVQLVLDQFLSQSAFVHNTPINHSTEKYRKASCVEWSLLEKERNVEHVPFISGNAVQTKKHAYETQGARVIQMMESKSTSNSKDGEQVLGSLINPNDHEDSVFTECMAYMRKNLGFYIRREGRFYVNTMLGIIYKGSSYVTEARTRY